MRPRKSSNLSLALVFLFTISMLIVAPQTSAQINTVSGGSVESSTASLTEISESGTLQLFDSNLGTLNFVVFRTNGFGESTITVESNGAVPASGDITTEVYLWYSSTNTAINDIILQTPNINTNPSSPSIWDSEQVVVFTKNINNLSPGSTSGPTSLTVNSNPVIRNFVDPANFANPSNGGTLELTSLSSFQNPGGGTFDVDCFSGTTLNTQLTGGNVTADQVTEAGCGVEITYNYTPNVDFQITEGPCWRTLSSPVDQSYQDFFASFDSQTAGGLWTQGTGITGARSSFGDPNVYTLNSDGTDWTPVTDLTETMPAGTGVLISVFDDDDFDGSNDGWPKTATFTAARNTASAVTLGTPNGTTSSSGGTLTADGGFSMMGNPFSAAIDFDAVEGDAGTTGIRDVVWVYDRNASGGVNGTGSGGWISYTVDSGLGDVTDGIIAPGQGFVVQNTASPGTPSIAYPESSKLPEVGTQYGKEKEKPDHLRLEIRGDEVYNSAWVQFSDDGSSSELIRGDAVQFYPFESEYAVLSTIKQGQMMDIGHFPYPGAGESIPLAVESTSSGTMTLSLTNFKYSGFDPVYLYDTITGESIELTEDAEYTFTPATAPAKAMTDCFSAPIGFTGPNAKGKASSPRFLITSDASIYAPEPDLPNEFSLNQNYPNPFNPTTQISYELPQQSNVLLEVYDMSGRQIATLVNESVSAGTHTVNFDASNLSSGVYLYKLQTGSAVLTRKLTLIK